MILARCPDCATTFRVTPEQLKARGGKVRCGQCLSVFNALDTLVDDTRDAATTAEEAVEHPTELRLNADNKTVTDDKLTELPPTPEPDPPVAAAVTDVTATTPSSPPAEPAPSPDEAPVAAAAGNPFLTIADAPTAATADAGHSSVRDTRELPGYSKWAERAVASGKDSSIAEPSPGARWPALLFSLLLLFGLLAQATYHFRSEIGARVAEARPWLDAACASLGCSVPLPRQAEAISIEGSELQADAARGGLLVLQATLRNRATFAQAYPALELTLTDTHDRMVIRRVLTAADYLSPGADPSGAFAAGSDLAVRLWIDARDSGAAGYRLYVFYP